MRESLQLGLRGRLEYVVPEGRTVPHLLPESAEFTAMPAVLATGYLVGIVEWACIRALEGHLDPGEQTLGVRVDLSHDAPTPPGETLVVEVELTGVDRRQLTFAVQVADQVAQVATDVGVDLDAGGFADAWRELYLPSMARVREGERPWVYLDTLHRESLDELLGRFGVAAAFGERARKRLVRAWHRLPPWEDAHDGLRRLGGRYTLAALSNGGFALLTGLVKAAGLPFDCILSAQNARSYKPDPQVYRTAAELLDVDPARVMMVAAHIWDIDGARNAGLRTAFLERPREKGPRRQVDRAVDATSDLKVASFGELADTLGC